MTDSVENTENDNSTSTDTTTQTNIIFSNPINDNTINNININNNISLCNGLFDAYVEPLRKTIYYLREEIKKLKIKIEDKEKKIKEKEDELDKKCSVCLTNKSNIIFIPCGHLCMCNDCDSKFSRFNISFCPMCRSNGTRHVVYT